MTTIVEFKIDKDANQVYAFFPTERFDKQGNLTSYSTVGQHSACSKEYALACEPAKESEYKPLYNELLQLGYTNLKVRKTIN